MPSNFLNTKILWWSIFVIIIKDLHTQFGMILLKVSLTYSTIAIISDYCDTIHHNYRNGKIKIPPKTNCNHFVVVDTVQVDNKPAVAIYPTWGTMPQLWTGNSLSDQRKVMLLFTHAHMCTNTHTHTHRHTHRHTHTYIMHTIIYIHCKHIPMCHNEFGPATE